MARAQQSARLSPTLDWLLWWSDNVVISLPPDSVHTNLLLQVLDHLQHVLHLDPQVIHFIPQLGHFLLNGLDPVAGCLFTSTETELKEGAPISTFFGIA